MDPQNHLCPLKACIIILYKHENLYEQFIQTKCSIYFSLFWIASPQIIFFFYALAEFWKFFFNLQPL